ncbi:MAG: F420-0:Gamma-glutamyl ligase [Cyanobacteriota bacterium]|nr:F420-0:Gamma-glutamyl ligase [Cyanobacteriota bacterium]
MSAVVSILLAVLLLYGLLLVVLQLDHRLRPASPLLLSPERFAVTSTAVGLRVQGRLTIRNPHRRMEVFVPEIRLKPTLLGQAPLDAVKLSCSISPEHPDAEARPDGYWAAYIVKGCKQTAATVEVQIDAAGGDPRSLLDILWLEIKWVNYGPFGRLWRRDGVLIPLRRPTPVAAAAAPWRQGEGCQVLPLGTHLLGVLDDPLAVLRDYAGDHLQPGDVLTLGETPLAVMQGRYHHPATVRPSALARLLCRVFHPTSSLATACGLQSLIDLVGPARVLNAWLLGTALKLLGQKGWFYRLAGDQARLIDDVTGTTPPYDQTIVLGPERPAAFCQQAKAALGIDVAVVDVNDLGRVKVLAASSGCDQDLLQRALRPNPAGNGDERTPLVLVRPH